MSVQPHVDANLERARQAKRDYQRQWRAKNPEKVRAAQLRYWTNYVDKRKQEEGKNNGS